MPSCIIFTAEFFKSYGRNKQNMAETDDTLVSRSFIHVCLSTNEDTIIGTMAVVNSIWKNSHSDIQFHILVNSETQQHLKYANYIIFNIKLLFAVFFLREWVKYISSQLFCRTWFEQSELKATQYHIYVFDEDLVKNKIVVGKSRQELGTPVRSQTKSENSAFDHLVS